MTGNFMKSLLAVTVSALILGSTVLPTRLIKMMRCQKTVRLKVILPNLVVRVV